VQELSALTGSKSRERDDQGQFQVFHLVTDELSVEHEIEGVKSAEIMESKPYSPEGNREPALVSDGSATSLIHRLSAKYEELQKEFHQLKSISSAQNERMHYVTTRLQKIDIDNSCITQKSAPPTQAIPPDTGLIRDLSSELQQKDAEISRLQRMLRQQAVDYESKISDLLQAKNELQYEVQKLRGMGSLAGLSRQLANFELFDQETPRVTVDGCVQGLKESTGAGGLKKENELLWLLVNLCDKELMNRQAVTSTTAPDLIPTLSTILSLKSSQMRAQ
jgi:DNA repair exonuclease SbcCD ATPase subunit